MADLSVPLSYAQERVEYLRRIFPGRCPGFFVRVVQLTGELRREALLAALSGVAARHEVLRSRYTGNAELPCQVFDSRPAPRFIDLSGRDPEDARETVLLVARENLATPLDRCADGGPWRAVLIRTSADVHVLVLVFDEAVMDRVSFAVFWRDLSDAYAGRSLAESVPGFGDYVLWERSAKFWPAGSEPVRHQPTELPYDRRVPTVRSGAKGVRRLAIDGALAREVRESASALGVETALVGLAVVAVLLGRYCRTESVLVGVTLGDPGRDHARPLGVLCEPLPVAVDLTGGPTFEELVERCARAVRNPGKVRPPLGALIEKVTPPRDLTRPALVQIAYEADGSEPLGFPGCAVAEIEPPGGVLRTDLTMVVQDRGERWCWTVEYDAELYEDATVDRLVTELRRLLADCVRDRGTPMTSLSRPPQPPAPDPVPSSPSLTAACRDVARRRPAACAVSSGDERLDYRSLQRWSDDVAHWLRDRGVGQEVPVGVLARRLPATPVLILGILEAGGAFVPLPPDDRDTALAEVPELELVLDPADPPVKYSSARDDREPPVVEIAPDNLFAYYRTSGSTGRPKVIATAHRGIPHYRSYLRDAIGLSAADVVLQIAPLTFDASIRDLLCPLAAGARVELLSDENARDPFAIAAAVGDTGATAMLAIVPSLLARVVEVAEGTVPCLRVIMVSGEALSADLAVRVRRWAPNARLVNQCGATECTMTSIYHEVGDRDVARGVIPIGRTITGAQEYVLDADGAPVPPGALGELHLAGPGLNRGYTSPGLTASAYLPNPFGPPGSRMFRTGDLVRLSGSGALLHQGRTDNQVKVRGVRVDLDACDAALRRCRGVRAAAAAVRNGDLVGYVVGSADGSELRRRLAESLPSAMVPNRYVRLAELPFTATGKVDRRALPDPRSVRRQGPSMGPRNAAELRMRACWEDVLEVERMGVHDDFFALGGTSLTVARLVRRVNQLPRVELTMAQVFATPTIEDLCAVEPRMASTAGRLLRLRRSHSGTSPVVILPDLTGGAARYQPLADGLGDGFGVLALETVGRAANEQPLVAVADLAAACVPELRGAHPVTLLGWGAGARTAVALAGLLERLDTPPRLVVAVHPESDHDAERTHVARYAAACGLPAVGDVEDDAALAAVLRHHKRRGQLPPSASGEDMRRLVAVFAAAEEAQRQAPEHTALATDLLHVHNGGSPALCRRTWVSTTGRTRHVTTPGRLAAVPGIDELAMVGGLLRRELG